MNSPIWAAVSGWELNAELEGLNALNIETLFTALEGKGLIYDGPHKSVLLHHFSRLVASQPNNLRSHVQRVYLSILCHDAAELTGALLDLFLTLKDRGQALRERLVEQGSPLLRQEDLELIKLSIEQNDSSLLLQLNMQNSVLCNGSFSLH
ncbi:hypothetical protein [Amphritea balenae]|uniref:Uncharacterized protein n=1 Tax=Amphritea balenae TaxID=452629 RepID=A0A3P1SKY6_9GAMM|nr:hypothetical protein [Amphritea balenae]RRC97727.1 hypothetical protein EHS89_16225 [Amphritea balenae]GGK82521.1 hypothetical protein GCM10007941_36210 [Amphritea balenae]